MVVDNENGGIQMSNIMVLYTGNKGFTYNIYMVLTSLGRDLMIFIILFNIISKLFFRFRNGCFTRFILVGFHK